MSELPLELYNIAQIRECERLAMEAFQISEDALMASAGLAAWEALSAALPDITSMTVICGKGNNGGDGLVLAALAKQAIQELEIELFTTCAPGEYQGAAAKALQTCIDSEIKVQRFNQAHVLDKDVIVDAVLGIGISGDVRSEALAAIHAINNSDSFVYAMDIPSGIDADTGAVHGQAVLADMTMTFIGVKQGLLTGEAPAYCGELQCSDLDLPEEIFEQVPITAYRNCYEDHLDAFLPRARTSHKGDFGHLLIVGGGPGMPGAARMAGEAALRTGAGLATVATAPEHIAAISGSRPELLCYGIDSATQLDELIPRATVIAIGPGLGETDWAKQLLDRVLQADLPLIIDASALNLLSAQDSDAAVSRDNWILTPHPGEAGRLLHTDTATIQNDRFNACHQLRQQYGGVIVLKGAGSLVQSPEEIISICDAGSPGMATAGMGDILTGIIAGLVAQGFELADAANIGVSLHANAGELAAQDGERGTLATDLLPIIRDLVNPPDADAASELNWA